MRSILFFTLFLSTSLCGDSQVTYTLSGGRFGDNLLAYLHAKWVSYKYDIPIAIKPFQYSDQLILDRHEMRPKEYSSTKVFTKGERLDHFISSSSALYVVPYFPESQWELEKDTFFPFFQVDWDDPVFRSLIKKMVSPTVSLSPVILPSDRISVALHIRRGGGYDGGYDTLSCVQNYPLKFPGLEFYETELTRLSYLFDNQPLYAYIFTDDTSPQGLKEFFELHFEGQNIEFGCRNEINRWDRNVLEDFFAMCQFDCAIHGESNLPCCAGFIADYKIEIIPIAFHLCDGASFIDQTRVRGNDSRIIEKYRNTFGCIKY